MERSRCNLTTRPADNTTGPLKSEVCLISPWGQSWEWVFHKHKCIQFIARVPKAQVLWTACKSACGKPFPKIVPMAKLHSLLACAFIMSTYNNLLLKAKGRKKLVKLQYVIIYYGEMKSKASFHHSRFVYYAEMMPLISFQHGGY